MKVRCNNNSTVLSHYFGKCWQCPDFSVLLLEFSLCYATQVSREKLSHKESITQFCYNQIVSSIFVSSTVQLYASQKQPQRGVLRACNFIKEILQHRYFSVKFSKVFVKQLRKATFSTLSETPFCSAFLYGYRTFRNAPFLLIHLSGVSSFLKSRWLLL